MKRHPLKTMRWEGWHEAPPPGSNQIKISRTALLDKAKNDYSIAVNSFQISLRNKQAQVGRIVRPWTQVNPQYVCVKPGELNMYIETCHCPALWSQPFQQPPCHPPFIHSEKPGRGRQAGPSPSGAWFLNFRSWPATTHFPHCILKRRTTLTSPESPADCTT